MRFCLIVMLRPKSISLQVKLEVWKSRMGIYMNWWLEVVGRILKISAQFTSPSLNLSS